MVEVAIEPVQSPTAEVRALIEALDQELAGEYLPEQQHGLKIDAIFQPHIRFFVARLEGVAVGCGGVALFDDFAEIKRMYVRQHVRGSGVARALLTRLEAEANSAGHSLLRLETGDLLFAAIRLYERAGFQRCEAFGAYAAMSPKAIETSLFYEKRLRPETGI
jgi:putative acetyltransferase